MSAFDSQQEREFEVWYRNEELQKQRLDVDGTNIMDALGQVLAEDNININDIISIKDNELEDSITL